MKKNALVNLKKKIKKYKILIFDLDNTIYDQKDYDYPALKNISKFLSSKIKSDKNEIYNQIILCKKKKNIFDDFLKKKKLKKNFLKKLVKKCVDLFQKHKCIELKKSKSLYNVLNTIKKNRTLYLVTNGNFKRQKRKIKFLKISKFFKKIYVLDGKRNMLKPSIQNVKLMHKFILKIGNKQALFIGDDKIVDKKFAENLGVKYLYFKFKNDV